MFQIGMILQAMDTCSKNPVINRNKWMIKVKLAVQ